MFKCSFQKNREGGDFSFPFEPKSPPPPPGSWRRSCNLPLLSKKATYAAKNFGRCKERSKFSFDILWHLGTSWSLWNITFFVKKSSKTRNLMPRNRYLFSEFLCKKLLKIEYVGTALMVSRRELKILILPQTSLRSTTIEDKWSFQKLWNIPQLGILTSFFSSNFNSAKHKPDTDPARLRSPENWVQNTKNHSAPPLEIWFSKLISLVIFTVWHP